MSPLLTHLERRRREMVALIHKLVELESPSSNKAAADRCAAFLAAELKARGAKLSVNRQQHWGDHLVATFGGSRSAGRASRLRKSKRPIMLLGHYDTVWEVGTLAHMPWRQRAGRLYGPGVFDMKAGIAIMLFAVDALRERTDALPRDVIVSLNGDEEVGSPSSRSCTEALARRSAAVLVLEPAQATAVKTARKGIGTFSITVRGVAAHSGLDFFLGQNAIVELAWQIERVSEFTDRARGLTVNVGVVCGGTRTNVVPAEAAAEIDVRFASPRDGRELLRKFERLRPINKHCRLEVSGGINRPPMERTPAVAALYQQAQAAAAELGFELPEAAVGGGSDGNFTGALGIPTLDGLGAVGEGAHAASESVDIDWLPKRAALLARLIETID